MAINYGIERSGVEALIPQEMSSEIVQLIPQESTVLSLSRRLPDLGTNQRELPVLNSLPIVYPVNGQRGMKRITRVDWTNVVLVAGELAVIVPIEEATLEDADANGRDIWGEVKPLIAQAFGQAIDEGRLYKTAVAPTVWPEGIVPAAVAMGNVVDLSTVEGGGGDLYDAVCGEDGVIAKLEKTGQMASGHVAAIELRAKMRSLRDPDTGRPLFLSANASVGDRVTYTLDGEPILFPKNGAINSNESLLVTGNWSNHVYAWRKQITYKMLTEASIHDPATGELLLNLAQQDMVALRCYLRIGFAMPNPVNPMEPDATKRFPFAVLKQ